MASSPWLPCLLFTALDSSQWELWRFCWLFLICRFLLCLLVFPSQYLCGTEEVALCLPTCKRWKTKDVHWCKGQATVLSSVHRGPCTQLCPLALRQPWWDPARLLLTLCPRYFGIYLAFTYQLARRKKRLMAKGHWKTVSCSGNEHPALINWFNLQYFDLALKS